MDTALSASVDLIRPVALPATGVTAGAAAGTAAGAGATGGLPLASSATRARIDATAKQFETQFLSVMLGQMFQGTEAAAPFGGGEAEATFKSFLTDAFAKSVGKHGGVGLSKDIAKEMLKLQGLN